MNRLPGVAERPELLGAHAEWLAGAVDAALLDVLGARLHDLLVDAQQPRREVRLANLLRFARGISRSHRFAPHFFDLLGTKAIAWTTDTHFSQLIQFQKLNILGQVGRKIWR